MAAKRLVLRQAVALLSAATASAARREPHGLAHVDGLAQALSRQLHTAGLLTCSRSAAAPLSLLLPLGTQLRQGPPPVRGFRSSGGPLLAKDYYAVLGIPKGSSDAEIKKAYYKLAKQYHPDTNQDSPSAAKQFQEVGRAYDTLRDPQKRAAYDQVGHDAYERMESGGGAPGGGGGPFGGGAGVHVDPEDLFREFFMGGGGGGGGAAGFQGAAIFEQMFGGSRQRRGQTIQTSMKISFEEAIKGTRKVVDLSTIGMRGAKPVEVSIPAGVDSGFQLRLAGQGGPGPKGAPPGDLIIHLEVQGSHTFARDGFDLFVEAPVDMADAALGTAVEVPTIDGRSEVKVKPGTQPNEKLRMRGYGVPMDAAGAPGRRGDQYVLIKVRVPKALTARQRELLEEFRTGKSSSGSDSSTKAEEPPKKRGWFG